MKLFCLFLSFFFFSEVFAASGASNGTDNLPISHGSSWFHAPRSMKRTVHYCVEIDPSFSVEKKVAVEAVETAVNTWGNYIKKKNISLFFHLPPHWTIKRPPAMQIMT